MGKLSLHHQLFIINMDSWICCLCCIIIQYYFIYFDIQIVQVFDHWEVIWLQLASVPLWYNPISVCVWMVFYYKMQWAHLNSHTCYKISHYSCLIKNGIRNQGLGVICVHCYWNFLFWVPCQMTKQKNSCVYTDPWVYLHIYKYFHTLNICVYIKLAIHLT